MGQGRVTEIRYRDVPFSDGRRHASILLISLTTFIGKNISNFQPAAQSSFCKKEPKMKKFIRAVTLLFIVFTVAVFLINFTGPEDAYSKDYSADDWYRGWRNHKDDPEQKNREWAVRAFNTGYKMDMAKKSYRKILTLYAFRGYIQEITLDGLVGVKARGESFLLATFNPYAEDIHNKHEAIVLKNLFEMEGGREGKIKFYFIDISLDFERAKREFKEVNLIEDVGLIQYIFKDGAFITDACAGVPRSSDAILSDLTLPKDEKEIDNFRRWMENFNPGKPGLILYEGRRNNPTYKPKPKP